MRNELLKRLEKQGPEGLDRMEAAPGARRERTPSIWVFAAAAAY